MLETQAIVISVEGDEALVESLQGGGCGKCDSENGCGSGKLAQLFCSEPRRFRVRNDANVQAGTLVQVTVEEGVLLRSAALIYVLPLTLLLGGALLGSIWESSASRDIYPALGGLFGLVTGFVLAKFISAGSRLAPVAKPVILSPADICTTR